MKETTEIVEEQPAVAEENKYRKKIDKLIAKQDIRYRGILSGRAMKIIGFVFLFCAQVYLCINAMNNFADLSQTTLEFANILDFLSIFALPMFLAANFCVIMSNKTRIKRTMIIYSAIALGIYALVLFVFYRYMVGLGKVFIPDDAAEAYGFADIIAKILFGKVINYNVFVDLALFSMFYYFLFHTPKKFVKNGSILAFRFLCVIPIIFAVVATVLYGFYNIGFIDLPVAVLAILPCRSITIYVIFFGIAFLIKLRQYLFEKWGGTTEEYERYARSNKSSLEISVISSVVIVVVCAIDLLLFLINPIVIFYGMGFNFYLAFSVPIILLLSYTKKTRASIWDIVMVVLFIFAVIILYLETGLYVLKAL